MDFNEWMSIGVKNNWAGVPVCYTHDGVPLSEEELNSFEQDDDVCIHIIRLYEDDKTKELVENDHPPSAWRQ